MGTTSKGFRYPASTAAPNVPVDMQNLAEDVDTYMGAWADYVPTIGGWTNTTVTSAKWRRVAGKTIQVEFLLTLTGTPASASLTLTLPATAGFATANRLSLGPSLMRDNSTAEFRNGSVVLSTTTTIAFLANASDTVAGGTVTQAIPWTWATGDTLAGMFTYREA